MKNLIKDSFKTSFQNADDTFDSVIIPEYVDPELKECIICEFEKEGVPVIPCQPGMSYNWVSQKCEYNSFSGFTPPDCYSPCDHPAVPTTIPSQLIECEGNYYFDTAICEKGIIETALEMNPVTYDVEERLPQTAATAILTAGLADGVSELEKEFVALACKDIGKGGTEYKKGLHKLTTDSGIITGQNFSDTDN
jgi:hypothetical protein